MMTNEFLLQELRDYYDEHNEAPKCNSWPRKNTISRRFNSWNEALLLAGIPQEKIRRNGNWTKTREDTKKRVNYVCKYCGTSLENTKHLSVCEDCSNKTQGNTWERQKEKAKERKLFFLHSKGGGCSKCGYNKNYAALHFHHLPQYKKEINLDSRSFGNNSLKTLQKEVDKCILLCANCHMEEHYPQCALN